MAFRDQFPVLEHLAYLNAGTDGPIPRAAVETARAELDAQLGEGRLYSHFARRIRSLRVDIRSEQRKERRQRAAAKARAGSAAPGAPDAASGTLEAIAACESGGNPGTNTGNGFYGKYQFTLSTWQSVGGSGNPASASEAEQNKRAALSRRA